MRALALKAEVSLATPYNLFGSKGAVLHALRLTVLEKFQHEMNQLRSRDPLDDLLHIAELGAATYASDPPFYRTLMGAMMASNIGIHDGEIEGGSVRLWQRPVEAAIRGGLLRADADAEFVARDLVISFLGVLDLWVRCGSGRRRIAQPGLIRVHAHPAGAFHRPEPSQVAQVLSPISTPVAAQDP